jgi:hypothetical protein
MTEIWFVRHGQTDWNVAHRFQGQIYTPLNATGFSQAHALAETLVGHEFVALYSSPITRARQTAEVISERLGLPVQIEPLLLEIGQGHWEDLTLDEVAMRYPDEMRAVIRDPAGTHAHCGGSSRAACFGRFPCCSYWFHHLCCQSYSLIEIGRSHPRQRFPDHHPVASGGRRDPAGFSAFSNKLTNEINLWRYNQFIRFTV